MSLISNHRHHSNKAHHAQLIKLDLESASSLQIGSPEVAAEVIRVGIKELEEAIHNIIVRRGTPGWLPFLHGVAQMVKMAGKLIVIVEAGFSGHLAKLKGIKQRVGDDREFRRICDAYLDIFLLGLMPLLGWDWRDPICGPADTPIMLAVKKEHLKIVKYFIDQGARVDMQNSRERYNVLHYAVLKEADSKKGTPLCCAASRGSVRAVKYLLNHGAKPISVPRSRLMPGANNSYIRQCKKLLDMLPEPFLPNMGKDFFQDIPKEMATEVFLRLPAKSVITCKGVCKSWSDLIMSSKFAAVHEQKLHARSCTILEFVEEALDGSDRHQLNTILTLRERYVVTYNPSKGRIYALFRYQAKSDDILKATFHGSYQVAKWNGSKFP
ncbi:hypothetical protein OROMI_017998 [Orobanche minor]